MKVLLDDCVPERLRSHLPGHEVHSVRFAGFSGRKNGDLLRLAQRAGYDVLLTVDQGVPYQQSMSGRTIAVLVLRAPANDIHTLKQMADAATRSLSSISSGTITELVFPGTNAK